ncbi:DJ-1/PfpI family protein, partial [Vibrio sp. 10N.222.49.C9]
YGTDIEGDSVNADILADSDFQSRVNNTIPVSAVNIGDYDAIFYPGGFGLLSDLATNEDFASIAAKHYEGGGIISAVCHGPGA